MNLFMMIVEYAGLVAFSFSGAMVAIDAEADLFGVVFLALVTTFGGGILRDVMLGITPPKFFTEYSVFVLISAISALAAFGFAMVMKKRYIKERGHLTTIINYFDAAGLGIYAVSGTQIAISSGNASPFIAVTMGLLTCIFGGLMRDLMLGMIPFVIKKRIYAVAAIAGSLVYYVLVCHTSVGIALATVFGVLTTFTLRVLATIFKWNMPKAIIFSSIDASEIPAESEKKTGTEPALKQ